VLGGRYDGAKPPHRAVAVGLGGLLGEHLARDHRAFWFRQREALHGFEVGFPDTLLALSPFELAPASASWPRLFRALARAGLAAPRR
jgi:hypothetical protein